MSLPKAAKLIVLGAALHALAAPGDETVLEEVVVSGYRQAPVLESGLSVSVLDESTIEGASVTHFEDLIPLVPDFSFSGEGSRARYFQSRGVGEREQYEGAPNPSVGFFIDDIDLSGMGGIASSFDLDRVEVLRGPQSARFGASALAGAVYLRSRDPGEDRNAHAELTVGDDGLRAGGMALGGPLGAHASARLAVYRQQSDGFRRNVYLGRATNARDELTARGKLAWDFGAGWEGLLTLLYADNDDGYDAWTVRNDAYTHSDHPGRDEQRTSAGSLRLDGPFVSGVDLVSITSVADSDVLFSFDGDWGNADFWHGYGDYTYDYRYLNPRRRNTVSEELRWVSQPGGGWFGDRTDWVAGLFWQRLDEDNRIDSTGVYDDRNEEGYCAPCLTDRRIDSRFESSALAWFASTETRLSARLTLSVGLRFERWRADYSDHWRDINYPLPEGGTSCSEFDCHPENHLWGGHVALGLAVSDSARAYLRVARGFKAGGFNPSLAALQSVAALGSEFIPYDPETLLNYELGLKGSWREGKLNGELSLFHMDRDDAQLSQSSQQVPFDPNSFVFVTYNGQARVRGLEASGHWLLGERWELHAALGLLDSEIGDTPGTRAISPDAVGRELAHAPGYTLNLGADYTGPSGWFGRIDLAAMDAFYFDISHNQRAQSHVTVNLRIGRDWGAWSLSAWVRNLFDEFYATRGFYFGNEPPYFENTLYTRFGDPRNYGLTLTWHYSQGA